MLYKKKKSDEILTSPITFVSTANAALFCNASVRLVDINRDTLIMDPIKISEILRNKNNVFRNNKAEFKRPTRN